MEFMSSIHERPADPLVGTFSKLYGSLVTGFMSISTGAN
jgi:hypothetical protein